MPRKKSKEQHKKDGTYRPHRHDGEPVRECSLPELSSCPDHIEGAEKQHFETIVELLKGTGLLKESDKLFLELYAHNRELMLRCAKMVAEDPENKDARLGYSDFAKMHYAHLKEMGMTPMMRPRVFAKLQEEDPAPQRETELQWIIRNRRLPPKPQAEQN